MRKKNKLFVLLFTGMIVGSSFTGCSNKKTESTTNDIVSDAVIPTQEQESLETESKIVKSETTVSTKKESEPENNIIELEEYFVFQDNEGKEGKESLTARDFIYAYLEDKVTLEKELDMYSYNQVNIGYTKANIQVAVMDYNDTWVRIKFRDERNYLVKREELNQAISTNLVLLPEEMGWNQKESEPIETKTPTFVVSDLSKTMYAKSSVNLRSGPSTSYEKIGSLQTNQEVTVTGQAENGWYQIAYQDGVAFVSNSYLNDNKIELQVANNSEETKPFVAETENTSQQNTQVETVQPTVSSQPVVEPIVETVETTYSEEEVISIVRSTLESNGIQWYPDTCTQEELDIAGPSGGMGWGESDILMSAPQDAANDAVIFYQYGGYQYFYIENLGSSNGIIKLRMYYG